MTNIYSAAGKGTCLTLTSMSWSGIPTWYNPLWLVLTAYAKRDAAKCMILQDCLPHVEFYKLSVSLPLSKRTIVTFIP